MLFSRAFSVFPVLSIYFYAAILLRFEVKRLITIWNLILMLTLRRHQLALCHLNIRYGWCVVNLSFFCNEKHTVYVFYSHTSVFACVQNLCIFMSLLKTISIRISSIDVSRKIQSTRFYLIILSINILCCRKRSLRIMCISTFILQINVKHQTESSTKQTGAVC